MPIDLSEIGSGGPWVRGCLLRFSSGVIGVPVEYLSEGWWRVVIIGGTHPEYRSGSNDIHVSPRDIADAERITIE